MTGCFIMTLDLHYTFCVVQCLTIKSFSLSVDNVSPGGAGGSLSEADQTQTRTSRYIMFNNDWIKSV